MNNLTSSHFYFVFLTYSIAIPSMSFNILYLPLKIPFKFDIFGKRISHAVSVSSPNLGLNYFKSLVFWGVTAVAKLLEHSATQINVNGFESNRLYST